VWFPVFVQVAALLEASGKTEQGAQLNALTEQLAALTAQVWGCWVHAGFALSAQVWGCWVHAGVGLLGACRVPKGLLGHKGSMQRSTGPAWP